MTTQCRWCLEGNKPNEKGEHWIVRSIIPAKIDIRKCKRPKKAPPDPEDDYADRAEQKARL